VFNIGRAAGINGITAMGETLVLVSGGLDLSISAVMAISGMVAGSLIYRGLPLIVGILGGLIVGVFVGLINGMIITRARINPLITTLATMAIARGIAFIMTGGLGIPLHQQEFRRIARGDVFGVPALLVVLLVVCGITYVLMRFTQYGRYLYAVGGNAEASRLCGLNVDRWRLVTYAICGLIAGLSGVMLASLTGTALPNAALGAELDIIAAAIIGGTSLSGGEGTVLGTLMGILLLSTLTNGLTVINVPIYWHQVIRGIILLLAVLLDAIRSGGYK
jgi:ribose transport system permease protein